MKRWLYIFLTIFLMAACTSKEPEISLVTREEGSGTRGAFVELFDIRDQQGHDSVSPYAEVTNTTAVMMMTVKGNKYALGYISLGSLSDDVKALEIDGYAPTVDNIHQGNYEIVRDFKLVYQDDSELIEDFMNFILSKEGQEIVVDSDYVNITSNHDYTSQNLAGKLTIGGSSSVTPVIDNLSKAYMRLNPEVSIEIQQSDSTTGVNGTLEGVTDIGMISRELKGSEQEAGLKEFSIAKDGIVMIVNQENEFNNLSKKQIQEIYLGEINYWSELND